MMIGWNGLQSWRHYAVIGVAISVNLSPLHHPFIPSPRSILWEHRGAIDFKENLCKFFVCSLKVIIMVQFDDSYGVSYSTAATNTN